MLEARITKAVIVQDQKAGGTVLMAVAEYLDDLVNIKVPYNWETLDEDGFLWDLQDKLAEEFDLPNYRVDVRGSWLLNKMKEYHIYLKRAQ